MAALSPTASAAIARLRAFKPPPTQYNSLPLTRRAAVLILLFADRRGDLRVVLTIRSAKLKNYAGHAALPGGKADLLTETPFQTARREAYEEIGLPLSDDRLPPGYSVEHLAELPANLAMTELGVRPCVAYLRASSTQAQSSTSSSNNNHIPDPTRDLLPKLEVQEVAAVFTAPFHNFLRSLDEDAELRKRTPGTWYKGSWHSWHEEQWRMHQFYVPVTRGSVVRGGSPPLHDPPMDPGKDDAADNGGKEANTDPSSYASMHKTSSFKPPIPRSKDQANNVDDALDQPRYRVFGMTARILVDAARVAYGEEPEFEHNSHFGDEDMIERLMRIGRMGPVKRSGEVLTRDVMTKAARI